tara:strand:+ start:165 stop:359 length:195 start_codon:yes stop_codon:yes gene_type:complete
MCRASTRHTLLNQNFVCNKLFYRKSVLAVSGGSMQLHMRSSQNNTFLQKLASEFADQYFLVIEN